MTVHHAVEADGMVGRYAGRSHDWRTNVWNVICSCGKTFQPPTTMLRYQTVQCPKCGKEARFDWNV